MRQLFWGKGIAALLGFAIAGPLGALLGLVLGHRVDGFLGCARQPRALGEHAFHGAVFALMGHIAKADGHVSEQEIAVARQLMLDIHLNPAQQKRAIACFNEGKAADFHAANVLQSLRMTFQRHPDWRTLCLFALTRVTYAEAEPNLDREIRLRYLGKKMGLSEEEMRSFCPERKVYSGGERASKERRTKYRRSSMGRKTARQDVMAAFRALGLSETADMQTIKTAYRRSMSRYHPDKLMARGASKDEIEQGKRRTQYIKHAYELLCQTQQS